MACINLWEGETKKDETNYWRKNIQRPFTFVLIYVKAFTVWLVNSLYIDISSRTMLCTLLMVFYIMPLFLVWLCRLALMFYRMYSCDYMGMLQCFTGSVQMGFLEYSSVWDDKENCLYSLDNNSITHREYLIKTKHVSPGNHSSLYSDKY